MYKKITSVTLGLLTTGSFLAFPVQAGDKPDIASVPGQTAIESPTPQPPQPESTIHPLTPSVPGNVMRDKNGTPMLVVQFELDHYDIPKAFQPQLDAFGQYLKNHPGATAELTGYADNSGHGPANATLSQKRADSVMAYLLSNYGIAATRIKAEGAGMITDKPDNSTGAARQADRRVYGKITMPKS